jgi:hypothetical protein
MCALGLCRFDQIYSRIDAAGPNPGNLAALVNDDPSNPAAWCTLAETLAQGGKIEEAQAAFEWAVKFGPGMSPVLMRAANFEFGRGETQRGFALTRRILGQTAAFDDVIFSYFPQSGVATTELLSAAIPAEARAATAWMSWIARNGTGQDALDTWMWMTEHQLTSQAAAIDAVWKLWDRGSFAEAQRLWDTWANGAQANAERPERLGNRRFARDPAASPFDWKLEPHPAAELLRREGLEIHFTGIGQPGYSNVHQFATVSAGRYRFGAEIETRGLTTDQRPFFHIFDAEPVRKVDLETKPIAPNAARGWVTLEFTVPDGMKAVEIAVERRASEKPVAGTLHVYQVSLLRL